MENIGKTLLGPRKKEANILGHRIPRSQQETDAVADWLVEKFNAPTYRNFFLKTAWRLDRGTIERLAATSTELATKSPVGYFVTLVRREKAYNEQAKTSQG